MWKNASRNIKSIFCKQQCPYNNLMTREATNDKSVNCFRKLSPAPFGNSHLWCGLENPKRGLTAQNYNKETPKTDKRNSLNYFHYVLGALRWTGVSALGLYILQPFLHRTGIFSQEQSEKFASYILSRYSSGEYLQLLNYFTNVQPFLHALPKAKAVKLQKKDGIHDNEINELEFDNLEKAHRSVLGSLSNFHGADCMNKGNYKEAIGHFEEAAQFQHPAALYNLGVCFEIGLGTNQDFRQAAAMYRRASDLGHATATYNLGVFYIHGLGDVKPDLNLARKLFEIAASQGQPNAQKALDMENSKVVIENMKIDEEIKDSELENSTNTNERHVKLSCRKHSNLEKLSIFSDSFMNSVKNSKTKLESNSLDDSGALDLSPEVNILPN